jgi:hypothetical protein
VQAEGGSHTIGGTTGNVKVNGKVNDAVSGIDTKGSGSAIDAGSGGRLISGIRHVSGMATRISLLHLKLANLLRELTGVLVRIECKAPIDFSYIVIGVRVGRALHDVHVGVELLSNTIPVPSRLEDIYARIMSSYLH